MNLDKKSTAKKGNGIIILAALLSLMLLSITLAFAYSQEFKINLDREQYLPSQDIYLFISGPKNTEFTIKVLNQEKLLISEKREKTNSRGLTYIHLSGFSTPGRYVIELTPFSPSSSKW
jgi:hypothetical protein